MDEKFNQRLWLRLLLWLHVNIAPYTASTEAINSTATAESTLAATAVTPAYATQTSEKKGSPAIAIFHSISLLSSQYRYNIILLASVSITTNTSLFCHT